MAYKEIELPEITYFTIRETSGNTPPTGNLPLSVIMAAAVELNFSLKFPLGLPPAGE